MTRSVLLAEIDDELARVTAEADGERFLRRKVEKRLDAVSNLFMQSEAENELLEKRNATLESELAHERGLRRAAETAALAVGREANELEQINRILTEIASKQNDAAVLAAINSLARIVESLRSTDAKVEQHLAQTYRVLIKGRDLNGDINVADVSLQ